MTISMYQVAVPVLVKRLEVMAHLLDKAEAFAKEQGIDAQDLLDGRLAPDMLALPKQVQIASDVAKGGAARLAGREPPSYADDEQSFGELRERLAKTIAYLQTFAAGDIDGSEGKEIVLKFGETEYPFTGESYLLTFVLPNTFFHATTLYAILRSKGVPLGKMDFLVGA